LIASTPPALQILEHRNFRLPQPAQPAGISRQVLGQHTVSIDFDEHIPQIVGLNSFIAFSAGWTGVIVTFTSPSYRLSDGACFDCRGSPEPP
jgi:hypothetical protein